MPVIFESSTGDHFAVPSKAVRIFGKIMDILPNLNLSSSNYIVEFLNVGHDIVFMLIQWAVRHHNDTHKDFCELTVWDFDLFLRLQLDKLLELYAVSKHLECYMLCCMIETFLVQMDPENGETIINSISTLSDSVEIQISGC